ncbi:MAG: hypothetical protein WDW38_010840 [Sanguina aurantia]
MLTPHSRVAANINIRGYGPSLHVHSEGADLNEDAFEEARCAFAAFVCLFEPRSFLERVTQNWEYQGLLIAAANCTDPADRLRYVVAFACSGLCRQVSFHKPFNPILGETYQATYANGVEVYCEQISHHPPVSSWQVYEPAGEELDTISVQAIWFVTPSRSTDAFGFVFYGNGNWVAGIKGNSVKGRQTGTNCIHFGSDGANVSYELPGLTVKGVLWGERVLKYGGEMVFQDDKNGLTCELTIDAQAPPKSFLSGWFGRAKSSSLPPVKPDMIKGVLKQGDTVLDSCSGNWLTHFEWEKGLSAAAAPVSGGKGGKTSTLRLWDIRTSPLSPAIAVPAALPSDCRHRQDLVHLKAGDQAASQEWKLKLEDAQRADRKLRKEGGGFAEH